MRFGRPLLLLGCLYPFMCMLANWWCHNWLWLRRLILSRQWSEDAVGKPHLGDGADGRGRRLCVRLLIACLLRVG